MPNFAPYFTCMCLHSNKIYGLVIVFSLAMGSIFPGCSKSDQPEGILPKEQLIKIMIDCYTAEARLNNFSIPRDSATKLFVPYEASLLKKYGVSDAELMKTYQYYFDHPTELEKIYEVVIDSLNLQERKVSASASQVN